MKLITVLGSTGSIGRNTLDVVRQKRHEVGVYALIAGRNLKELARQITEFRPALAVVAEEASIGPLIELLGQAGMTSSTRPDLAWGEPSYMAAAIAPEVDFVMSAIVGVAGLEATYQALRARKRVGLANKETLVAGGRLVMDAVHEYGAELIPVDSEHNAIFQCMPAGYLPGEVARGVTRVILTASGGPFRTTAAADLPYVTQEQACAHPKWKMGRKISVDSATLMNKGLEVIEATLLFGLPEAQVDIVVHPQSVVHSLVQYADGSLLAQLGAPDMRTPIAQALAWPERITSGVQSLDLAAIGQLDFEPPDHGRFPALELARCAARAGGTAPALLNAANEVAVQAFLDRRLNFTGIAAVIDQVLQHIDACPVKTLDDVLEADATARRLAAVLIEPARGAFA
jgi:1-deoxy-D-xylulose-5-phosphate reductoisomerase